jgi:hypothetical protein
MENDVFADSGNKYFIFIGNFAVGYCND